MSCAMVVDVDLSTVRCEHNSDMIVKISDQLERGRVKKASIGRYWYRTEVIAYPYCYSGVTGRPEIMCPLPVRIF